MTHKLCRFALLFLVLAAGVCLPPPPLAAQTGINVTGTWVGVNYTSKVPGPAVVKLDLQQTGSSVTGTYCVSTGVCGKGQGTVSGSAMEIVWKNTTPSCPGEYLNKYQVSTDQMTWKFTGQDCLGSEEGHGYAKKE